MSTPILYTPKPGAKWADFGSGGHPLAWYASLVASGFDGVILDTYSAQPSDARYALQAGLGVMMVQGYDPAAWADPALAVSRAQQAVAFAQSAAYPAGATVWLDFESCATSYTQAAAWINTWAQTVRAHGYWPGIYVGAPQPLSGLQLYALLTGMIHYWESESTVPMVARRGYQIRQEQCDVMEHGVLVDLDRVQMDDLGGLPHGMIQDPVTPSPSKASTPPVPDLAALQAHVADLATQTQHLQTLVTAIQQDLKGV